MGEWIAIKLGDELRILTDYTANGSFESLKQNVQYYNETNYAVLVRTTDLGKSVFKPERFTDEKGYSFLKTVQLFGGEIVIANVGSLGKAYRVPNFSMKMVLAPNMYLLKFKESIDEDYIFQYLISNKFKDSLLQVIGSTTLQAVNKDNLRSIKLNVPFKPEQTHIAEILSTTDEAIAHTVALIAKYQRIKTGLMQDLLTKGIDENGNIRSKETHKFVVKNGIEVPEEWEVDTLKNTCNLHNNLRKPIAAIDRFQNKGSFPYYGATGIIDYLNEYRVEGTFVLIGEDGDHYLKFKTQEMTHLVDGKFNVSNHAHILSGKENCSTKWIHYFFCHRDITYFLTRQGAGRFKLNKASLQNLPICIPSPNEQLNIIERIESFNENYNLEKIKLKKLNSLKTGLMQDLLSGKVRVNMNNKN
jgi:type I restriction enzyme S subunit